MKIRKILTIVAVISVLLTVFTSCTRSEMIDYSELNRRLKRENKSFAFAEEGVFYGSSVYFAPYSLLTAEDMLLTMGENEKGQLVKVTLTASVGENTREIKAVFSEFACALIKAYVPEEQSKSLITAFENRGDVLFSPCIHKAQSGRYIMWLTSNSQGVSLQLIRE